MIRKEIEYLLNEDKFYEIVYKLKDDLITKEEEDSLKMELYLISRGYVGYIKKKFGLLSYKGGAKEEIGAKIDELFFESLNSILELNIEEIDFQKFLTKIYDVINAKMTTFMLEEKNHQKLGTSKVWSSNIKYYKKYVSEILKGENELFDFDKFVNWLEINDFKYLIFNDGSRKKKERSYYTIKENIIKLHYCFSNNLSFESSYKNYEDNFNIFETIVSKEKSDFELIDDKLDFEISFKKFVKKFDIELEKEIKEINKYLKFDFNKDIYLDYLELLKDESKKIEKNKYIKNKFAVKQIKINLSLLEYISNQVLIEDFELLVNEVAYVKYDEMLDLGIYDIDLMSKLVELYIKVNGELNKADLERFISDFIGEKYSLNSSDNKEILKLLEEIKIMYVDYKKEMYEQGKLKFNF